MDADELQHRIKNAIILLADGHSLKVSNLTFGCKDKNHFSVTGWTLTSDLINVTKQTALGELADIKTLFTKMTNASNELADFIKNGQIECCLGFDYGMICTAYNLRRIFNILDKNLLKAYLKAFGFHFCPLSVLLKPFGALDFVAIGRIAFC